MVIVYFYSQLPNLNANSTLIAATSHCWLGTRTVKMVIAVSEIKGNTLNTKSPLLSVLQLLNSSETIDHIYPQLRQIIKANFGCAEIVFALSNSADDVTIYLWDATAKRLDATMTLHHSTLHPSFSQRKLTFVPQIDPTSPYLIDNLLDNFQLHAYIVFPLIHDEQSIGTLTIAWQSPNGYATSQLDLLEEVIAAITVTLMRSRRVLELRDTLRNTRALYTTSHSLISTASLSTVLNNVVNNSAVAVSSSHCTLHVFANDSPEIKHVAAYRHPLLPSLRATTYCELMDGLAGWVVKNRKPARLKKNQIDPRETPIMRQRRAAQQIGAMIIAPVIYHQHVLGVLTALNTTTQPDFSEDDLALLSSLANQAAVAIAKARLYQQKERQIKTLANLRDFSLKMQHTRSVDALLSVILTELDMLFRPAFMVINLIDREEVVVVASTSESILPCGYRLSLQQGVTGAVAESGKLEIIPDIQADPRTVYPPNASELLRSLRTMVSLPLLDNDKLIGVMNIAFDTVRDFDKAEQTLFQAITSMIGGALQHVILLESLEQRVEERNRQLIFANDELQRANKQLQELDELKNKFISDVSHELRTPLTSLGLYLDLLKRRPDRQAHYLGIVRHEVDRLRTLVLDVLKIARYDSGRVTTDLQHVCLTDIVMREVAMHRERAEAVGIEIEVTLGADRQSIVGDAAQLSEMVTALLYNAINYTESGKIEIHLTYLSLANGMELCIKDSGIGIPADELDHIFQRFYRGSNVSTRTGNGLGLNIVEEIVRLHNGYVSLTSELGKGTIACVLLPTTQNIEETVEAKQAARMTISR